MDLMFAPPGPCGDGADLSLQDELIEEMASSIGSTVARILPSLRGADREDFKCEVVAKALCNVMQWYNADSGALLGTWASAIARNESLNRLRSRGCRIETRPIHVVDGDDENESWNEGPESSAPGPADCAGFTDDVHRLLADPETRELVQALNRGLSLTAAVAACRERLGSKMHLSKAKAILEAFETSLRR